MPIQVPGKVLLRRIPLKFVTDKVAGGGKKSVDQSLPLVPFIDFLIVLVVFLIMNFAATGDITPIAAITMPNAANTEELEISPIVTIDDRTVTLGGIRVADTQTLAQSAQMDPITPLVQSLDQMRRNWAVLHPNTEFPAAIVVQADVAVDYRVIKKVMFSAAQSGYSDISFAVNSIGG